MNSHYNFKVMEIRFCPDGKKPNAKGLVNLKVGIHLEGFKPIWAAAGIQVPAETFNTDIQLCLESKHNKLMPLGLYNDKISNARKKLEAIKMAFEYERVEYSPEDILEHFKNPCNKPITFLALIEKTLNEYSITLEPNTLRSHQSTARNIREYLFTSNQSAMLASKINNDFLRRMDYYFRNDHVPKSYTHGEKMKSTSVEKIIKFVKKVIAFGVDSQILHSKSRYQ